VATIVWGTTVKCNSLGYTKVGAYSPVISVERVLLNVSRCARAGDGDAELYWLMM